MFKRLPGALMLVLFLAGCSHQGGMQISSSNPASPSAAEAPAPKTSQDLAPGVSGQAAESAGESKSSKKEVSYTCPMHPQVVKPEPGNCPICGMKLVPKK